MADSTFASLNLAAPVQEELERFLAAAQSALGSELVSAVLFGSAAEGKLRATSDVNVILVLSAFDAVRVDALREQARTAQAAIRLRPMLLLQSEIPAAAHVFAPKFADISRRRRVLCGPDPFQNLTVARADELFQLRQQLLNLRLRLRATYLLQSLREEQLALAIADAAAPLRSCAAALVTLEGQPAESPRKALERVGTAMDATQAARVFPLISQARETRSMPPGTPGEVLFFLLELTREMESRAARLA